ncbi:MAG: hypothetical protein ACI8T1_003303 [Verrucomicrobiales bacterium]|jgi:hypothetical protein
MLFVTGEPKLTIDTQLIFPLGILGSHSGEDLLLTNTGTEVLTITGIDMEGPFTRTTTLPLIILPGESSLLPLTYTPTTIGVETRQLQIVSDAVNGLTSTQLFGVGAIPPEAEIDRSEFNLTLGAGAHVAETLTLTNQGATALRWEIGVDYGIATPLPTSLDLSGLTITIVEQGSAYSRMAMRLVEKRASVQSVTASTFDPVVLETTDVLDLDGAGFGGLSQEHELAVRD